MENCDGEIGYESRKDGGNTLLDPAPEQRLDEMKTLVLIDSDALTRALISQCLAGQDWRVLEAEDGQAGLDLVLKHKPAAVRLRSAHAETQRLQGLPLDSRASRHSSRPA